MKKIIDYIKNFIKKHIVDEDPYVMKEENKEDFWEKGRIYEKNPITNEIRARKVGVYGNERKEKV